MQKVRIALLGAGWISQAYSSVLETSDTAELVAVADTNLEAAARIADVLVVAFLTRIIRSCVRADLMPRSSARLPQRMHRSPSNSCAAAFMSCVKSR